MNQKKSLSLVLESTINVPGCAAASLSGLSLKDDMIKGNGLHMYEQIYSSTHKDFHVKFGDTDVHYQLSEDYDRVIVTRFGVSEEINIASMHICGDHVYIEKIINKCDVTLLKVNNYCIAEIIDIPKSRFYSDGKIIEECPHIEIYELKNGYDLVSVRRCKIEGNKNIHYTNNHIINDKTKVFSFETNHDYPDINNDHENIVLWYDDNANIKAFDLVTRTEVDCFKNFLYWERVTGLYHKLTGRALIIGKECICNINAYRLEYK